MDKAGKTAGNQITTRDKGMTRTDGIHKEILTRAAKIRAKQISWRRQIHRYPELAMEEYKTTALIKAELKRIGLKILPLKMKTGVLAELKGTYSGPVVAIRSDIDALPVQERTGLSYASKIEGRMHACGHDVHVATVLGCASVLADMKKQIPGTVRFIFQPAEEKPPGGARPMIKNGAIKGVAGILGLHVDPHLPVGKIGLRDDSTMAAVYDFDLTIIGTGGHAARPHRAVDAIATAAEVVESLQKVVSRETDPISGVVITFGRIEGGSARNVIADRVHLVGTARTLSDESSKKIPSLIRKTVRGICQARGAKFEISEIADYPPLSNDPAVNKLFEDNCKALFGSKNVTGIDPTMGGEDFACYLQSVPGAMFRLGIKNKKIGSDKSWHSPLFKVDESAMYYGTSLLAAAAIDYLANRV